MEFLGIVAEIALEFLWGISWGGGGTASGRHPVKVLKRRTRDRCAYCRNQGGHFVTCQSCRAPHHRECATVNRRCAVYACRNRRFLVPAA